MTPAFACGWECGDAGGLSLHWNVAAGSPSISTTTVRSGTRSLRCNPTAATSGVGMPASFFGSGTRHIARLYVRFATLPSADCALAIFAGAGNVGPQVRFKQSDSKIYAAVGTTLGASGVSVTTGQWYRIDYDFNVNTTGADFCDVQVDGSVCGQATGTGASGSSSVDAYGVLNTCTADVFFDDLVCSSTAADYPIGAGFVNHFIPTSDGTHNIAGTGDFQRGNTGTDILNATTTAFQLIDDVPLPSGAVDEADNIRAVAPPNATDYPECVFGPASGISTPTAGPRAVEVILAHHQIATQTGQMVVELNDNGTVNTIFDTGAAAGVTTYRYARKHYATAPTGGAWTVSAGAGNFNNIRVRFRAPDPAPDQCLDAIMIEAEFAEAGADLTKTTADDINNFADARLIGYGHLYTESINNLADTAQVALGLPLTLSDNANNLADAEVHVLGVTATAADSLQALADALVQLLSYELAFADSEAANWADSHNLLLAQFLALADSYSLTDTTTLRLEQREVFTDTFALSDVVELHLSIAVTLTDNINNLTDSYSQVEGELKTLTDSLTTLTDSLALGHGFLFIDNVNILADDFSQTKGELLAFTDSISLTDTESHVLELQFSLSDDINLLADSESQQLLQLKSFADSFILTDELALGYGLLFGDDTNSLADAYAQTLHEVTAALELILEDVFSLNDSLALGHGLVFADSVILADAEANILGQLVSFSDSITLTDTATLVETHLFDFNDSFTLVDSESRVLGYNELFDDALSLTDAESSQLDYLLAFNDSIDNLADAYTQLVAGLLNFTDSFTLTDSHLLGYGLVITEDINLLSDAIETSAPQGPLRQVGTTDALTPLSDEVTLRLDYLSSTADTLALTDSIILNEELLTSFSDSLVLSDATATTLGHLQPLADSFVLSDAVQLRVGYEVATSDVLVLSDTATLRLDYQLATSDTLSLADVIVLAEGYLVAFSDTFALTDAEIAVLGHLVPLVDSLALTDAIQLRLGYELALTDTVTLSDSTTLTLSYHLTVSDNAANWADSLAKSLVLALIIADNGPTFIESINFFSAGQLQLTDTLTLTDALTKSGEGFLPLADSFILTDDVDIDLRGPDLDASLTDTLELSDAIVISLRDELRLQLTFTDAITLLDHYFDLRHPYTPSAKRHVVVPSRARVTTPTRHAKVVVPASDRTTEIE